MLTAISAFYGIGPGAIQEMTVGLRRRYYEEIPRHQAERNLHLAGAAIVPHAGDAGRDLVRQWQARVSAPRVQPPGPTTLRERIEWLREEWQAGRLGGADDGARLKAGIARMRALVDQFRGSTGFRQAERDDRARSRMRSHRG